MSDHEPFRREPKEPLVNPAGYLRLLLWIFDPTDKNPKFGFTPQEAREMRQKVNERVSRSNRELLVRFSHDIKSIIELENLDKPNAERNLQSTSLYFGLSVFNPKPNSLEEIKEKLKLDISTEAIRMGIRSAIRNSKDKLHHYLLTETFMTK